jgi:hypothetical protein
MLPFLKVPAESYRLAMAIFTVPLMLAIWMLMAGSARLLSILSGRGRVSFDQYLNLFGFGFFAFMIVAAALDFLYSGVFGGFVLAALEKEYGPIVKSVVAAFPPVMYTTLYGLGGAYNAIAAREGKGYSIPSTLIVGCVTFSWPTLLVTLLLR